MRVTPVRFVRFPATLTSQSLLEGVESDDWEVKVGEGAA